MSEPTTFGRRLRQFREDAGLTQQQLADLAGVAKLSVVRYEGGATDPAWEVVRSLAAALGKTPNDFLPPDPPPKAARPRGKFK